jgi:hypothetical protein
MAKYLRQTTSGAAGSNLGTTIKYLRRTTSGAAGIELSTTIKYLRGAAGIGLGTTIKYLRRTASAAAGNGLCTTSKYLRGATDIGLGATIKYLRRTPRQHSEDHGQVPATHGERRCGQRPEPMPVISDVYIHNKCPTFVFFFCARASVANKGNSTVVVQGLSG